MGHPLQLSYSPILGHSSIFERVWPLNLAQSNGPTCAHVFSRATFKRRPTGNHARILRAQSTRATVPCPRRSYSIGSLPPTDDGVASRAHAQSATGASPRLPDDRPSAPIPAASFLDVESTRATAFTPSHAQPRAHSSASLISPNKRREHRRRHRRFSPESSSPARPPATVHLRRSTATRSFLSATRSSPGVVARQVRAASKPRTFFPDATPSHADDPNRGATPSGRPRRRATIP